MGNILVDDIDYNDYKRIIESSIEWKKLHLFLEYFSYFKNTKKIRELTEVICDFINIPWKWKSRLILIIDEMNNNAIEHWSMPWDINYVRFFIDFSWEHVYINIEVEDTWNWVTPKKAFYMKRLEKQKLDQDFSKYNSIRWRWLFLIIYKLVDELYFKDSHEKWWLIVWIKKLIKD